MQNIGNRICPYCGKQLILVGKVLGAQYHNSRIAQKHTQASIYVDMFEKDNLWLNGTDMFCSNCGVKICLQKNPFSTAKTILFLAALVVLFANIIAVLFGYNIINIGSWLAFFCLTAIVLVCAGFSSIEIKKYRSNFVFSTDLTLPFFNNSLYPDAVSNVCLMMKIPGRRLKKYLILGNVYAAEIANSTTYLQLMNINASGNYCFMDFRFCGTYNEGKKYTSFLANAKHFRVVLRFEGIFVGNAEVLETYDPPKSSDKER